eukprot:7486393-Pyramimonas_sp.AAC.1
MVQGLASYSMERRRHMSMTAQTEGKVRELSAMFEARTMWHTPSGGRGGRGKGEGRMRQNVRAF